MHPPLSGRRPAHRSAQARPTRRLAAIAFAAASGALGASPLRAGPHDGWLPDDLRTPAAYVVEADGRVLAQHAAGARRQPASLAKLAGALVAAEAAHADAAVLDAMVTVGAAAARAEETRAGLTRGDRLRASQLLEAMLVGSANDACLALAEHLAGSAAAFVARINALAARIGMADTRFVDPCGFDRPNQHTTANDLLKLARRALAEPRLLQIVERPSTHLRPAGGERALALRNTNALLENYEGAFGMKTGYTRQAGPCLIAVARRGSSTAIVIVLGARDRWPVSVAMLDEAFDRVTGFPRVRSRATIGEPDS